MIKAPKSKLKNASRQNAQKYGLFAETLAAFALRIKGYKIVARNFKTKLGEIDIIARKGDLVAIVEVKARKSLQASVDSVGYQSTQRIQNAADLWLAKQADAHLISMRFDIVAVQPKKWPVHIKDAF